MVPPIVKDMVRTIVPPIIKEEVGPVREDIKMLDFFNSGEHDFLYDRFTLLELRFDKVDQKLDKLTTKVDHIEMIVQAHQRRMNNMDKRLRKVEDKVTALLA